MSDEKQPASTVADKPQTEVKPAAEATAETPAKAEPPFTVDSLLQSTARFTHKAWYLFYNNQKDMDFIRKTPVRFSLEARSAAGAEELHRVLLEGGTKEITRQDKMLHFTVTYETLQTIIKHPHTYLVDAVRI